MLPLWFVPFGKGFAVMLALIVAIGIQNAFVLRQGVKREAVFLASTICFLCDVALVTIGTAGLGALIAKSIILRMIIALGGATFLCFYGMRALFAAKHAKGLDLSMAGKVRRRAIVGTALAVSLLNPHSILDTVVIVGGLAAQDEGLERALCALGAISASALWFYSIGYGAHWLAPVLSQPKIWRFIDLIIGFMMLSLAFGLIRDGWVLFGNTLNK